MSYPERANFSYVSFENALKCLHARQGSLPIQGTLSTCPKHPARWGSFLHVNGSCRAIPANRGEINHENMAARCEFFRCYHLPMLPAEQNDSQSEEINVIDESQAENRPMPMQEAEIRWQKVSLDGRYVCCV